MTSMKIVQFLHPLPPSVFFCLSEWVQIAQDPTAGGRQNLGYHFI